MICLIPRGWLVSYDETGAPIGIKYRTEDHSEGAFDYFFFEKNLQGDIVAIYNAGGKKIGSYIYDAWGNFTISTTSGNTTLENSIVRTYNPFRYRGYYYDTHLGLYYLQSRYYNSQWGRFINADDVIAGAGGSIHGYNVFAYSFNNPINMLDSTGNWPQWMKNAANWVNNNIIQPIANFFSPSTNTISGQFQEGIFRVSGKDHGGRHWDVQSPEEDMRMYIPKVVFLMEKLLINKNHIRKSKFIRGDMYANHVSNQSRSAFGT